MNRLLKHAGTAWMAVVWLLVSLFRGAFEPAAAPSGFSGKEAVTRFAANSAAQSKLQFNRFAIDESDLGFEKTSNGGPFDFCLDSPTPASWLKTSGSTFAGANPAHTWRFKLRVALNPRAPCLA